MTDMHSLHLQLRMGAALAALLTIPTHAAAQSAPAASSEWTVDDVLTAQSAGNFEVSPDNRFVVWTKSEMDTERGRRHSNLWITRLEDGESWALTHGKDSFGSPKFSPDGEYIAFTSSREVPDRPEDASGNQLWILRLAGGEPWSLTTTLRGLRQFEWKGASNDTIVFSAQEAVGEYDRAKKRRDDTGWAVEDTLDAPPVRIWALAVESKAIRRLTDNRDPIQSMALSPDGTRAVTRNVVSLSYGYDAKQPPRTYLVDLATGERREILTEPVLHGERPYGIVPGRVEWTQDGRGVLMSYEYSSHPVYRSASVTLLGYYDVEADRFGPIELEWERALNTFEVVPDGFIASLEDGVRTRPVKYVRSGRGWTRTMIEGEHAANLFGWTVSRDGTRIAYNTSTATTPAQPYAARIDGARLVEPKRLAELNPSFARKPKVRAEIIHWVGALGDSVEGVLYYPQDYQAGRRYPLIHNIHGGPASADRDAWTMSTSSPLVLYLKRGAFVVKTNYHGSCCYGLEWVESIGDGKYYDLEVPDLEAGVDHLIERGLVHPDSVATTGWSNGAILSTALTVANPERYKASVAGAGDVEWISDWGNVDFGASFDNYYFGASPLEDPQRYIDKSPFFKLGVVRTPTLLFTGTEDRNVPPSQSWSHFRALQQLGNVETRLVIFPGEPHGLGKLAHQRRKIEEEMRWLDRHLWGRPDTTNLALNESSPLAALLKRNDAARDGRLLGVRVNGILAPELVKRDSLEVGRFEVTRAQWREFDASYAVEPGTENHPANGIGFERAQAYASWLTERTGRPFRLPTKAEWEKLGAPRAGNTLDYWAGNPVNPEDAERLASLVAKLNGDAPLLREAGSTAADVAGSPPIYDLAGNVAEWAVAAEGSGEAVGGSADRPSDRRARPSPAAPAYRGLRVVVSVR